MRLLKTILAVAAALLTPAWSRAGESAKKIDEPPAFTQVRPDLALILAGAFPAPLRPEDGPERTFTCPPGSAPEGEVSCGFPTDTVNGGCNTTPRLFSPINCGFTICGTTAFNGVARDTDWYQLTQGTTRQITLTVNAEFRALFGFVSGTGGLADCNRATGINPFGLTLPNQPVQVTACLGPGTWWFFVAPDFNQQTLTCGTKYTINVACSSPCPVGGCCLPSGLCVETAGPGPCDAQGGRYQGADNFCFPGSCDPPANDNCADAPIVTCNSTVFADTRNATFEPGELAPACAQGSNTGSVWFKIRGTGTRLSVTTCGTAALDPDAKDSVIAVYLQGATCQQRTQVACSDDAGCGPTLRHSRVCFNTSPNADYLIQIVPFNNLNRGVYKVDIECACIDTPIGGACCFANGSCASFTFSTCAQFQGVYQGDGTTCSSGLCPVLPPPANDFCDAATPQLLVPGSVTGYTLYGTPEDETEAPECGFTGLGPGVWYRVIGNGKRINLSTCSPQTDFDTRIRVYCGDCASESLVCVAANDNSSAACGTASETSWCSEPGRVYSVLVAGGVGSSGNFVLSATTETGPCAGPASCSINCAVTCPGGSVPEGEASCFPFYVDATNGGCGTPTQARGTIACGQTVCGTSGTFPADLSGGLSRDTDWFRFTLTQQSIVTWTVRAEFLAQAFILNDDCGDTFAYAGAIGNGCQEIIVSATLDPGTYNVFVSPQFFEGVTCGAKWTGTLTCVPTAANGACCLSRCSCVITTETDCLLNQFGLFFAGPGSTCAQTNCNPCPADINLDGTVNTPDLIILLGSFGRDLRADFNCSGATDTADLTFFLNRFGLACPTP